MIHNHNFLIDPVKNFRVVEIWKTKVKSLKVIHLQESLKKCQIIQTKKLEKQNKDLVHFYLMQMKKKEMLKFFNVHHMN